jgi:hypothetical protein
MTTELTLSLDPAIISRAKRYAKRQGVSVSRLVEIYLAAITQQPPAGDLPPLVASLRGALKKADANAYRQHLAGKYL